MIDKLLFTFSNVPTLRFPEFTDKWKRYLIKDLFEFKNGLNKEKTAFGYGSPIVNYMDVNKNRYLYNNDIKGLVSVTDKEKDNYSVKHGDVFFTRTSESSDEIGLSSVMLDNPTEMVFSGFVLRARPITNKIVPKFCSYCFSKNRMRNEIIKKSSITTRALTSGTLLNEVINYYPSKPEQEKISGLMILLDERIKTQIKIIEDYEVLIKGLLKQFLCNNDNKVKEIDLASICTLTKGQQINGDTLLTEGPYYVMNGGITPSGYHTDYNTNENTISISEGGNSCGYVQFNFNKFWSGGHCYTLNNLNEKVLVKYIFYYLKANEKDIMNLRIGTGLPNIQKKELEKYQIQLNTIENQNYIINLFDTFYNKLNLENNILEKLKEQKKYLLSNMFI